MTRFFHTLTLGAALTVSTVLSADAQERTFNFALRGGLSAAPEYPGSDDYELGPDLGFTFGALQWGPINAGNGVRGTRAQGLAFRGAFRVIGDRDADDNPELAGLDDIDTAVELGVGVIYRAPDWQVYGDIRQGFGGHDGITGTLGGDLIFRPNDRLTITAGPRLHLGNSEFAQTYFGVSAAEAATSSFSAFEADGGLIGAGFEVEAIYELDDRWALAGALSYEKLQDDAADSPITQLGSDDQWRLRLGLSRVFTLRF